MPAIHLPGILHTLWVLLYECAPFPGAQPGPGLRPLPWQHRSRARMSSGCAQRGYCARPWWGNFPWHGSATGWLWEGTALLLLLKRGQLRSSDSAHFPSGASSILGNTVIKKERKKKPKKQKNNKQGRWVSRSTQRAHAAFYQSGCAACWTHRQQLAQHPTAKPEAGPAPSWQQILGWVWAKKGVGSWGDGARSEPIKIHLCAADSHCIQQVIQAWT